MKVKKLNQKKKSYKGKNNATIVKNIGKWLTIGLVVCEIFYLIFNPQLAPNWFAAAIILLLTSAMWAIGAHPQFAVKVVTGQLWSRNRNKRKR